MDSTITTEPSLREKAFETRKLHFDNAVKFYAPGLKRFETSEFQQSNPEAFQSISVTGAACALNAPPTTTMNSNANNDPARRAALTFICPPVVSHQQWSHEALCVGKIRDSKGIFRLASGHTPLQPGR